MKRKNLILFLVMFFAFIINVDAAFMRDYEVKHTNPNGKEVTIYLTGDEYFRYAHDKNGYVLIKNEEGYYTYATLNNGIVVSSNNIYDMKNTPSNKITKDDIDLTKNTQFIHHFDDKNTTKYSFKAKNKWTQKDGTAADVLEFNNTVIFIRFKGESEFINTTFTNNLKHVLGTTNTDSTGLKSYVYKVTEGHVNINNTVLQTKGTSYYSYESNRTREYLQYKSSSNTIGYSTETEGNQRLLEVLNAALSAMPAASASVLDGDGDGVIDNVIFIASGSPDGWDDALWPHKWSLNAYGGAVTFSGVKGGTYNLQFARDLLTTDSSTISKEVAVFSHETMHSLGLPDLYRYYDSTYDGDPVYKWDMMNYDQEGTYVNTAIRNRYGFTKINNDTWSREPRTITESGEYQLNLASLNTGNTSYRINTTDSKQYIQLEYRGQNGIYDSKIPYSGLLISRINTNYKGNAGTSSTPIQDEYYIFRPGETSIKAAAGDVANAALKPCTVLTGCNVSFGNQSSSASITNKAIVLTSGTNTKIYIKDVYKNTNSSVKFKVFLNGDKAYLNITEYTGSMGDTFKITPEYAETVYTPTYLSLNPETATVDQNGNVALVGPGSTTIKVTISGTVYQTVVYSNPYGLRTFTGRLLSPNQIRLDYGVTGTGIDEYVIYRSEGTSDDFTEIGRVTTPYYTDSTFVFGRTYTYKVSAVASGEEYVFDQTVTVDSSSYLPETVSGITFITTSKSSATLNFNPTQNADGYNIYTSDNIIGPYVLLDTAVSNTYDFTNLDIAKNYFIKVAAYREFGGQKYEGTRSDAIVINTREYLLNPPLIRSAEVISNNQIRITFSSIETATGYNVWVSTDNKTYTKLVSNITGTSYVHNGVQFGKTYYYKVNAILPGGYNGYKSNEYKIQVTGVTPQNVVASSLTFDSIKISYNMVENADGYEIQYSTDKKKWTKLATTTALTYTHKKLTYNKAYYYKVRSYKKVDGTTVYSNFSATVNAKPLSQAPTVTVTQLDNGSVKLTYKSDSSATLYKIYKKTNSEEAYTLLTSTSNITYTVKNLTLGETTSFKVVAYKAKVMGGETIVDHNVTISTPTLKLNGDTLSWSSIKDAESYSLYQCSDTCTLLVDTPQLTYTSSLINNDKIYYYYVVATNSSFVSAKSAYVTNVEAFTDSKVIMNYSTNTNAATFVITSKTKFDGYALYMSTSKKGTYTKVASTSSLGVGAMINYTKATYNKTLYYKVRPYVVIDGKTVYGAYSDVVTFKNTLNNIPLKFTNVSNTSIKIDWDKITSATKYELYYSINGAKYKKVDLTTNTYTHKNLKYGDKINYYVRAVLKIAGKTYYGDSKTNPYAVDVESPKVDYTVTNLLNGSVKITTKTSGSYYVIVDNETITFTGTTCVLNGLTPNETYEFIVGEYVNGTYGQGNGKEVYVFDRIDAPTLDVRYDSSTSATIMWDDLGTNITYKIYLEGNKIYEGTNTVLSQYNLIPGKAYEYEIEVTYDDGNKTVTSERKSSIVRTLPDVINDFTVTVNGNLNAMTVTAEPISTATYYYLLYRNSTKEEYKILAGHNEPNFVNVKVTAGKTYYLMVASAADYNGKLFYSEKGTEKIVKTLPAQVTGITATSPSYNSNKITWTKISGTTGYEIYYSTNNKTWKKITSTTSNSYTHKSLTTGTTYYYKVRTYKTVSKKNYYGDYSMVVNTKPLPASPTGLKVVRYNYSSKMNTVSWAKVTGASGYTLYSSIDGGNTYKTVASTTKLTYTDKKASANGTYYKVRAYRTVSGKKVYGAYSKEIYMRAPLEPNYSVYISSNYYSGSTATPMIITNNGNYSIKILSKGAFLLDRDYASFDRTMKLINTDTFKNISSTTCAAGEDCLIAFKYSSTWVDQYTRYYFDFIYDGVKYQAKSSYYYQNTYTKYSEKSES